MRTRHVLVSLIALVVTGAAGATGSASDFADRGPAARTAARYIVQATTARAAARDVARVGGRTDQDLAIIRAVSAHLNPAQVARLRSTAGVRVFEDRSLITEGNLLTLLSPVTSPVVMLASSLQTPTDGQGTLLPSLLVSDQLPDAGRCRHTAASRHHRQRRDDRGARLGALAGSEPELCVASTRDPRCAQWRLRPGPRRSLRSWHARDVDRGGRRDEYFRQLLEHRAAGKIGGRARLRRHGRRPLRRCDRRSQLDRRKPEKVQHSRAQSVVWRGAPVVLLGRSAGSSRHGRLARRHRRGRRSRQRGARRDDDRCARERALRHHHRRIDGQLHTVQCERRSARLVFFRGTDLRRVRQTRTGFARRPHRRLDAERQLPREYRSRFDAAHREAVHHVRHLDGGRSDQRRRRR